MVRISVNTTKSGEVKKNKKQRLMTRVAMLKYKDPCQILEEMKKIDEIEYNVLQPLPCYEKLVRDKRKRLKETFDLVMRFYHNHDPERWSELKRKEVEYEKERLEKQQYHDILKLTHSLQIDEIPLPSSTPTTSLNAAAAAAKFPAPTSLLSTSTALLLPPFVSGDPPGALKKTTENLSKLSEKPDDAKKKETLGVPIGPRSDLDTDEVILNIDDFMTKMENVNENKVVDKETSGKEDNEKKSKSDLEDECFDSDNTDRSEEDDEDEDGDGDKRKRKALRSADKVEPKLKRHKISQNPTVSAFIPAFMPNMAAVRLHIYVPGTSVPPLGTVPLPMMLRPPPRPPGMQGFSIRMPSWSPLGARPQSMSGMEMPGLPSGLPPRMAHHKKLKMHKISQNRTVSAFMPNMAAVRSHNVPGTTVPPLGIEPLPMMLRPPSRPTGMHGFSIHMPSGLPLGARPHSMSGMELPGPPSGLPPRMAHHNDQQLQSKDSKGITTTTAKPQNTNPIADVTCFEPSTLRCERDDAGELNRSKSYAQESTNNPNEPNNAASKDDADKQPMDEVQELLQSCKL